MAKIGEEAKIRTLHILSCGMRKPSIFNQVFFRLDSLKFGTVQSFQALPRSISALSSLHNHLCVSLYSIPFHPRNLSLVSFVIAQFRISC